MIPLYKIREFTEQSSALGVQWDEIAILGGEPTLHPDLQSIVELLLSIKPGKLFLHTNGILTVDSWIRDNTEVITVLPYQKKHTDFNCAPLDVYGPDMPYRRGCKIAITCGLGYNGIGYYSCAAGAAIDRVFGFNIGVPNSKL